MRAPAELLHESHSPAVSSRRAVARLRRGSVRYWIETLRASTFRLPAFQEALRAVLGGGRTSRGTGILLSSGLVDEAFARYGADANRAATYLATFRAVAKKYATKLPEEVLERLVASTPGDEGVVRRG